MAADNLPYSRTSADGAATQNHASASGGLWKAGIAAVVVAAAALAFASEQPSSQESEMSGLKAGDTKTFTLPGGVEMEMVYVAPGSFTMGSPESEAEREKEETQHRVTLTKGFWIGKYPVTQRQWKALVQANGVMFAEGEPVPYFSRDGKGRDVVSGMDTSDFPMENISWDDCKALMDALNKNERGEWHWSFPTEAQWEFAARGGTKSRGYTYSGGNDLEALGWYYENSGLRRLLDSVWKGEILSSNKCRTHSVREKDAGNELGIVGMSGNVCEWCLDWYDEDYYTRSPADDPCNTTSGVFRVLRGGCWGNLARYCRSALRVRYDPGYRYYASGFRLCYSAGLRREAEPEERERVTEKPPMRSVRRPARAGSHGKVQLWEGGPYWAEMNIGAEEPWESGYYFWWGDTVGYKREGNFWVASDGSTSNFSFNRKNIPTVDKDIDTLKKEGWITADGVLAPECDAAHVHWGGGWRMPTSRELDEMVNKCDWKWTTMNGIKGYVVQGRGDYASANIFLPASGDGYGTLLINSGSSGLYGTSIPDLEGYNSYVFYFNACGRGMSYLYRYSGQSVRPVQGFTK